MFLPAKLIKNKKPVTCVAGFLLIVYQFKEINISDSDTFPSLPESFPYRPADSVG